MRTMSLLLVSVIGLAALLVIAAPGSTGIGAAMQDATPTGPTGGPGPGGPDGGPSTQMPMLQHEDVAVSAINALDARLYAEDAVLHDLATLESYEGQEAIDGALAALFRDRYPDVRFQRVHVTALPNAPVVLELHACLSGLDGCESTYVPLVWIFEIEEQQIVESRLYYNPALFPAEDEAES